MSIAVIWASDCCGALLRSAGSVLGPYRCSRCGQPCHGILYAIAEEEVLLAS